MSSKLSFWETTFDIVQKLTFEKSFSSEEFVGEAKLN